MTNAWRVAAPYDDFGVAHPFCGLRRKGGAVLLFPFEPFCRRPTQPIQSTVFNFSLDK